MNEDVDSKDVDDISEGKIADNASIVGQVFSDDILKKFEVFSYRNAAVILANSFPSQFADLTAGLEAFKIEATMIKTPGGSKGPIAKYVDTIFTEERGWIEARISANLHVRLLHAKRKNEVVSEYVREGYLDGHRIDFLNDRVALDLEWNSKDQTYEP